MNYLMLFFVDQYKFSQALHALSPFNNRHGVYAFAQEKKLAVITHRLDSLQFETIFSKQK